MQQRWDELVAGVEAGMADSWLEAHLIPLSASVRDYEVRRLRAIQRAKDIAPSSPLGASYPGATTAPPSSEVWVQSHDGLVGGYIDRIELSSAGPVLQDYKTGKIRETQPGHDRSKVKENYAVQIKLYAALYAEATGTWPHKLELVPLQGDPVTVEYTPAESMKLLDEARAALEGVNKTISSASLAPKDVPKALAKPGERTCQFCPFRPGCKPYHLARSSDRQGATAWPADVSGKLVELRQLGNGKVLIFVQTEQAGSPPVCVRDITPTATRHPALRELQKGDIVGLYNLLPGRQGSALSESSLTVIYKHVADIRGQQ